MNNVDISYILSFHTYYTLCLKKKLLFFFWLLLSFYRGPSSSDAIVKSARLGCYWALVALDNASAWCQVKWEIAFHFASGRTQAQAMVAGAFGNQMLYPCIFGLCGVLWTSFVEPFSPCLQSGWCLLKAQWYLPSFCLKTNGSDEMEGKGCQERQEKTSEQNIWKLIVIQITAQPCQEARDEQGTFFSGTFQEAAFITNAPLTPYCLTSAWAN